MTSTTFYGDSKIQFNEKGDRVHVAYDIVNINNQTTHTVGYLDSSGKIEINEKDIVWAGEGHKPLEITLPRHLRAVAVVDPPFVYSVPIFDADQCRNLRSVVVNSIDVDGPWYACQKRLDNTTNEQYCCSGLSVDLLSNLSVPEQGGEIDTSFTFDIHLNECYGSVILTDDGYKLSGMIEELDSDTADLAIGALTINPDREQHIDFSEPWHYHGIQILEKWKPRSSAIESFLQPLKLSLWTTLFISVLLIGCAIFILDTYSPLNRFNETNLSDVAFDPRDTFISTSDEKLSFGEAMWFVWGVLLNSGVCEKTPRGCSARVLGIVWCGFCMIIVASYTANLAAFLVLDQPDQGLSGLSDSRLKNPTANFTYGTVLDTNTHQYFKRHVELSTLYRNMEPYNVKSAQAAIDALMNETLDAFIWDSTRLEFEASMNCHLRTRGPVFGRSSYGIGLKKNSPWTPHITNAILRLSESGKMETMTQKWIHSRQSRDCGEMPQKPPVRLGLSNMRDVFILVAGGIGVGILLNIIEISLGKRRIKLRKRYEIAHRYGMKWKEITFSDGLKVRTCTSTAVTNWRSSQNGRYQRIKNDDVGKQRMNVMAKVNLNFDEKPVTLFCSRCRNYVTTRVRRVSGFYSYCWIAIFIALFLWPCALLPCFLACFADTLHYCPECSHRIGRYRRGRKPQFFV
ncbi:hypothetical protein AB6A40_008507 [Gnathostoma spinigerum]|uniref:LITAF domain-containing protein n=1 Tax=Gnathostoma spinigerum TaxID=75299 RepID=A0ABD6EPK7_9BILA